MMKEIYRFWKKASNSQEKTFLESFCDQIKLNPDEAVQWLKEEFSPGEAKKWIDKNFSLEQAKEWRNNGVRSPEGAEYWENQGYHSINDVGEKIDKIINEFLAIWEKAEFSYEEAAAWIAAGFLSPAEAAAWIFMGFSSPKEAAMWKDAKFFPGEAAEWVAAGFSLSQAIGLRAKYGSPLEALKAMKRNDPKAWEIFNNSNNLLDNNFFNSPH